MRTIPFGGLSTFDLPPGFYVSGGDPLAAYDSYEGVGRCQNRCVFCLEDRFLPGEGAPFPAAAARPRLDIGNWEPTSLPSLPDLVKRFSPHYERIAVFTNGRRLDAALARRLADAGAGEVVVSLHGPDAATHDALTRAPGSFDEAVAGVRAAVAAGLRLGVSFVFTRANRARWGDVLALAERLGARAFHASLMVPLGPAARAFERHGPSAGDVFASFSALARARRGRAALPVHLLHFPVCLAESAGPDDVAVALTPRRGSFEALLEPSWAARCGACRWAPWCEGMKSAYAPRAPRVRGRRSR